MKVESVERRRNLMNGILCVAMLLILLGAMNVKADQITWFDGSKYVDGPPGKLLTDN